MGLKGVPPSRCQEQELAAPATEEWTLVDHTGSRVLGTLLLAVSSPALGLGYLGPTVPQGLSLTHGQQQSQGPSLWSSLPQGQEAMAR